MPTPHPLLRRLCCWSSTTMPDAARERAAVRTIARRVRAWQATRAVARAHAFVDGMMYGRRRELLVRRILCDELRDAERGPGAEAALRDALCTALRAIVEASASGVGAIENATLARGCEALPSATLVARVEKAVCRAVHRCETLEYARACAVCLRAERSVVFFPCRHVATCAACSRRLDDCCICRAEIDERVGVFV